MEESERMIPGILWYNYEIGENIFAKKPPPKSKSKKQKTLIKNHSKQSNELKTKRKNQILKEVKNLAAKTYQGKFMLKTGNNGFSARHKNYKELNLKKLNIEFKKNDITSQAVKSAFEHLKTNEEQVFKTLKNLLSYHGGVGDHTKKIKKLLWGIALDKQRIALDKYKT